MNYINSFDFDYCYVQVDCLTGFATIRDVWDGLEIATLDSLEEAIDFLGEV